MSILWDVGNYTKIKEIGLPVITTGTQNMGNGVYKLKAGTPIDEDGAVSNDGDAVCLVAEDFFFYSNTPTQPKLVKVIESGYVDLNKAEAAAGITFASAAKSALATAGIILVDGALDTSGGGGSSGGVVVTMTRTATTEDSYTYTGDKTAGEVWVALGNGSSVVFVFEQDPVSSHPYRAALTYAEIDNGYIFKMWDSYGSVMEAGASTENDYLTMIYYIS